MESLRLTMSSLMLLFMVLVPAANSLKCFSCTYADIDADIDVIDDILSKIRGYRSQACYLRNEADKYEVAVRECGPDPGMGRVYKCGEVKGRVKTKVLKLFNVYYETIERGCISVPAEGAEYQDGCHDDLPEDSAVADFIKDGLKDAEIAEYTFTGTICYTSQTDTTISKQGTLQCPQCSKKELSSTGVAGSLLDLFHNLASNDHCYLRDFKDKYEVDYTLCAPVGDNLPKCIKTEGEVSGTILSFPVTFSTYSRGCVLVPPKVSAYSDGCHSSNDDPQGVELGFLEAELEAESDGSSIQSFSGEACYVAQSYALQDTSGADHTVSGPTLIIITLATILVSQLWNH